MDRPPISRRHDLDALRAIAMLLGIMLHAAMSFFSAPWPVQDTQQNLLFALFVVPVHGFRMHLFFLVSGFFTAMLWRRGGVAALVKHRALRVLAPCLIGLVTIVPLLHYVYGQAAAAAHQPAIRRTFTIGEDPNGRDPQFGVTLLSWAALQGDLPMAQQLMAKGAQVNGRNSDGTTPLHCAMFVGQEPLCRFLLEHGADPGAQNAQGGRPVESAKADMGTTQYLFGTLRLPARSDADLRAGREKCIRLLPTAAAAARSARPATAGPREAYTAFVTAGPLSPLVVNSVFEHLWFLWQLCWMLLLFLLWAAMEARRGTPTAVRFRNWIVSPLRFLWLIPLSLVPQLFMGIFGPEFGPDTATGWLPPPHLLIYYGIFYFFGALYYDADDRDGSLGRHWWLSLPLAVLIIMPLGLSPLAGIRPLSDLLQVAYAWLMVTAMIGLFRKLLSRESRVIRYLSEASYWMYLAHLPLVVYLQMLLRPLPILAPVKFVLLLMAAFALLLVTYQFLVRNTLVGVLLNGRRNPGRKAGQAAS